MGYISTLTDKGYLNLQVKKTDNNLLEEVIDLSSFYEKISILLINNEEIETNNKGILSFVEKELARPISSLEIQMIEGWKNNNISDELIKEAIKLALNDGVYSLKYIDKILIDWKNHGYKDVNDVKNTKQDKQVEENINDDITDWDWLEDEEEYIAN